MPATLRAWKLSPRIKVFEALGALADDRISMNENGATVRSSSGNKSYIVTYDSKQQTIISNDNGSYWQGYLGYPAIAYLLKLGKLPLNIEVDNIMKEIEALQLKVGGKRVPPPEG